MTTPFGPQLIGETEKTLGALLRRVLAGRLSEPQWVTLRLAASLETERLDAEGLADAIAERAHFPDARTLVQGLESSGYLGGGRPTDAGRALLSELQGEIAALTRPIWEGLPPADVEAAGRLLREIVARGQEALAS